MFVVRDCEHVCAPIDRCFLLSTHLGLMADVVGMQPVARDGTPVGTHVGGLMREGDRVVWQGRKFGLPLVHESRVCAFDSPNRLVETMARGRFRRFEHDQRLSEVDGHTLIVSYVRFSMPLGPAGRLAGRHLVVARLAKLLRMRLLLLKRVAESEEWRQYL